MNKPKDIAMSDPVFEPPVVHPSFHVRRAVVQASASQLPHPDEALLPMPPHNKPLNVSKLLKQVQQKRNLLSVLASRFTGHLLGLLKRRL